MQVNIQGLKSVKSKIESARTVLANAARTIHGINIPGDFEYAEQLRSLPSKIISCRLGLANIKNWVDTQANQLESAQRAADAIVNSTFGTALFSAASFGKSKIGGSSERKDDNRWKRGLWIKLSARVKHKYESTNTICNRSLGARKSICK